jgi:hypothetical protein
MDHPALRAVRLYAFNRAGFAEPDRTTTVIKNLDGVSAEDGASVPPEQIRAAVTAGNPIYSDGSTRPSTGTGPHASSTRTPDGGHVVRRRDRSRVGIIVGAFFPGLVRPPVDGRRGKDRRPPVLGPREQNPLPRALPITLALPEPTPGGRPQRQVRLADLCGSSWIQMGPCGSGACSSRARVTAAAAAGSQPQDEKCLDGGFWP